MSVSTIPTTYVKSGENTVFVPNWRADNDLLRGYAASREGEEAFPDKFLGYDVSYIRRHGDAIILPTRRRKLPDRLGNIPMSVIAITVVRRLDGSLRNGNHRRNNFNAYVEVGDKSLIHAWVQGDNVDLDELNRWVDDLCLGRANDHLQ